MNIDPRHLIHLVAIADHGSVSHAADALHMSQPALSSSIATLETRLGVRVLTRDRRGAVPNEVGEVLVRRGRELKSLMHNAVREAKLRSSGVDGPLAVGATPSMTATLIPDILAAMGADMIDGEVTVIEGLDNVLIPALQAGEIDVMLGPRGEALDLAGAVVWEDLFYDRIMLGMGPDHPLAGEGAIALSQLSDLAWVLPHQGSFYPRFVESLLLSMGVPAPARRIYCNSFAFAEAMVMRLPLVTPVSQVQLAGRGGPVPVGVPIEGVGARRIGLYLRAEDRLSNLERRFVEAARTVANGMRQQGFAAA